MILKIAYAFLFVFWYANLSAQVRPVWKITPDKPVFYNTVLEMEQDTNFTMSAGDSGWEQLKKETIDQFNDVFEKKKNYTILKRRNKNVVDVKLTQDLKYLGKDSIYIASLKNNLGIKENIIVNGAVYTDGGIYTYFMESQQKSLLCAAFELPQKSIKKGDQWRIDFSCLDIEGVYFTDTIYRNIVVKASDIIYLPKDTVVVVTYNLEEYFKGLNFSDIKSGKKSSLQFKYTGKGEFSVTQGRWLTYNALFFLETKGRTDSKLKGRFALRPVDDIPGIFKE